jgi:hypothetical protein
MAAFPDAPAAIQVATAIQKVPRAHHERRRDTPIHVRVRGA